MYIYTYPCKYVCISIYVHIISITIYIYVYMYPSMYACILLKELQSSNLTGPETPDTPIPAQVSKQVPGMTSPKQWDALHKNAR